MIPEEEVTAFIGIHKAYLERSKLSFFEMTVGMAFHYFSEAKVDLAVIEVGLGGRLDSTNIICPEVCLITNIGLDHTELLGDSLDKIAYEKAGIIKPYTPVVISERQEETTAVFMEVAQRQQAKIIFADEVIKDSYKTSLLGAYQSRNVKGVIAVIRELKGFTITEENIGVGLMKVQENTGLLGRWQLLGHQPKIIADTAHNREGLFLVLEQLRMEHYEQLHIVLGFVKEKNLDQILPLFPKGAHYYFCRPDIPRGLDAEILKNKAASCGLKGEVYASVTKALEGAKQKALKTDLIFIGGSTFTVAEVL